MSEILTVNLPDIGEGVVEGEVIAWLKAVGDDLAQDEPVVQVMTDKATVELPAVKPGKLAKQHVEVGVLAIKDKPLYDIEVEGSAANKAASKKAAGSTPKASPDKVEKPAPASKPKPAVTGQKALASPSTRHYAREKGVNIHEVSATGKVTRASFYEAVMRSSARLTYGQVNEFLTGRSQRAVPGALHDDIRRLHDVYKLFARNRYRRGALELQPRRRERAEGFCFRRRRQLCRRQGLHDRRRGRCGRARCG